MQSSSYRNLLVAGGASTVAHGVVWKRISLPQTSVEIVAFLCSNHVQVFETQVGKVTTTLRNHEERLNCLGAIVVGASFLLVTGSERGNVSIWRSTCPQFPGREHLSWELIQSISPQPVASVSCLSLVVVNNQVYLAIGNSKGKCHIYCSSSNELSFALMQSISFPSSQLPNTLHFVHLHQRMLGLCIGAVDAKVHIYSLSMLPSEQPSAPVFQLAGNLWGHEEWITCLHSVWVSGPSPESTTSDDDTATEVFLASGSQDNKIRIWKFVSRFRTGASEAVSESQVRVAVDQEGDEDSDENDDEAGGDQKPSAAADQEGLQDSEARLVWTNGGVTSRVFLESLLLGHEDWVASVSFLPNSTSDSLTLFSTSMDRNMVLWSPDRSLGGVWSPAVRVGDIGGALGGAVGANLLGFVSGCVAPDAQQLLGIGYGGSFHLWVQAQAQDGDDRRWEPRPLLSGHFDTVTGLSWAGNNDNDDYLLSCSQDQTCRLFAPLRSSTSSTVATAVWKEVSRPLVHGYGLTAVLPLRPRSDCKLLVAAEEKVLRVVAMPHGVVEGLRTLADVQVHRTAEEVSESTEQVFMPELGLSNKPSSLMNTQEQHEFTARHLNLNTSSQSFNSNGLLESQLTDHTLWLETQKLYGHAQDVLALSSTLSADGMYIASACRSHKTQTSQTLGGLDLGTAGGMGILVWHIQASSSSNSSSSSSNMGAWEVHSRLDSGHEGSVVSLAFSPAARGDGSWLVSVGKDRAISLHRLNNRSGGARFETILTLKNAHKRIIWDACWWPDGRGIVTVSRDGAVKFWELLFSEAEVADLKLVHTFTPFSADSSVTAVDVIACDAAASSFFIVLGSATGDMRVHRVSMSAVESGLAASVELVHEVAGWYAHSAAVRRLRWRRRREGESGSWVFASCGEDHTVRVHELLIG